MDIKYIQKVLFMILVFCVLILILRFYNDLFETPDDHLIHNPLSITMLLEGMENPPPPDTSIIMNKSDAFCEYHRGNSGVLETSCEKLTQKNCNSTSCCVWACPGKCLAGGAGGPTFNTNKNGKTNDLDYYYFQGKCFGKGCSE